MNPQTTSIPNTSLWRTRRRLNLERKQVAWILGHSGPDQIARYERGDVVPNFDNAIKLSVIYRCAIEELFPLRYAAFRRELASKALSMKGRTIGTGDEMFTRINSCTYEDALADPERSAEYFPHVRDHVTKLAKRLAGL